jgi:hypothetical protein
MHGVKRWSVRKAMKASIDARFKFILKCYKNLLSMIYE